jgi:hypothetical protein
MTSSYHWKGDGSELVPITIGLRGKEPLAYQSDPFLMSDKHIARSYANTKLAQIWHSRSIKDCESVCACVSCVLVHGSYLVLHIIFSCYFDKANMGSNRHSW